MSFQSPQHANANALQKDILMDVLGTISSKVPATKKPDIDPRAKAQLIGVWIELEHLKRELRGIPRLKPCDVEDLIKKAKRAIVSHEPIEIGDGSAPQESDG